MRSEASRRAQLEYRAQPDKWSVLDVLEHLTLAEPQYWKQHQEAMKRPASGEKSPATDEEILWYGIDRSRRAKTGEARTSKGELKDPAAGLASFLKLRTEIKEYSLHDDRGSPRSSSGKGRVGLLPVGADDFDALHAPHPADSRNQGRAGLPAKVDSGDYNGSGIVYGAR